MQNFSEIIFDVNFESHLPAFFHERLRRQRTIQIQPQRTNE